MYKHFFKRVFDLILSLCIIVFLSPFFIVLIISLYFANRGGGVFFLQERVGKAKKRFKLLKFKSMTEEVDEIGNLLPDKDRITSVGKFLRKTSFDELPQLINILFGQMSFIGPRPLLEVYLPYYTARENIRFEIRPGISGLSQISGRSYVTWDDQLEIDAKYVEKMTFLLDIKIFIRTIPKVLGSADMMVLGRIDKDPFDVHRQKQIRNTHINN